MQKNTQSTRENWMNIPSAMQICIQNCTECYQMCSHLVGYCLTKGNQHANAEHIKLLLDCARICNLSSDFMIRHSEFHDSTCKICAEVCTACAASCDKISKDDPLMQACAEACRKCATTCTEMATIQ